MHAYLLISHDTQKAYEESKRIAETQGSILTPFILQKIADVRNLNHYTKLALSPTCFFIENIEDATTDALNAFLKQLEEPGKNISYILTCASEDKVLGTIVSRCQVIKIQNPNAKIQIQKPKDNETNFIEQSIGEQLGYIDRIKKRDDAIFFLEELIMNLHEKLLDSPNRSFFAYSLSAAQDALTALGKNGNVTIQLTRLITVVAKPSREGTNKV